MKTLYIITGANRGIGKAICDELLLIEKEKIIVSISRKLAPDQVSLIQEGRKYFVFLKMDLANLTDSSQLKPLLDYSNSFEKICFFNNAGTILPIGCPGSFDDIKLLESINLNTRTPIFIVNCLLKWFPDKIINIVNITSGAANYPIEGWATYCASKSFVKMFFNVVELHFKDNQRVTVFNFDPGIVNTDMQVVIRRQSESSFPRVAEFLDFFDKGKLQEPNDVALKLLKQIGEV